MHIINLRHYSSTTTGSVCVWVGGGGGWYPIEVFREAPILEMAWIFKARQDGEDVCTKKYKQKKDNRGSMIEGVYTLMCVRLSRYSNRGR